MNCTFIGQYGICILFITLGFWVNEKDKGVDNENSLMCNTQDKCQTIEAGTTWCWKVTYEESTYEYSLLLPGNTK